MRLWVLKTTAPVSLSYRPSFCLGHGHKLPAGHRARGGCLESRGDDRQTAGEPTGFICVQWGPAHSLTGEEQGTELMKPRRARLPAPAPSLPEHGSPDDCRLPQASPSPSTLSSPAFSPSTEQNHLFLPPFWNRPVTYRMMGGERVLWECCSPQNYVIRPFPLLPTSHGPS